MQISYLSSNRREQNLAHLFQFKTPARKLTHHMKFEHFCMQKDMNFGNTIIIHHFGPENSQNPIQKDRNFEKMHSLTSAKMPTNKESICFSRILNVLNHDSNALINPIQYQPTNHFLGTPSNTFFKLCRPIVIYLDSSTLVQDAVLNCYNGPAHNHYQLSYFSETNLILCSILAQICSGC